MKIYFIRSGAEVLKHVEEIRFIHPATVQIAIDTLGPDKTVGPELSLHPCGERAKQDGMQGFYASLLAAKAEVQTILLLGNPHEPRTITGYEDLSNAKN